MKSAKRQRKVRMIFLIGIPGAGKTTFAERFIKKYDKGDIVYTGKEKYVNLIGKNRVSFLTPENWDRIRDKVAGDVERALSDSRTNIIIYDETNTTTKYLKEAIYVYQSYAKRYSVDLTIDFFVFDDSLDEDLCRQRVAQRDGWDIVKRDGEYFRKQAYKFTKVREEITGKGMFNGLVDRVFFVRNFKVINIINLDREQPVFQNLSH